MSLFLSILRLSTQSHNIRKRDRTSQLTRNVTEFYTFTKDRIGFLHALATMAHPESVPINALVPVKGTPLGDMLADTPMAKIDEIEFVRTVAVARILMPQSMVRLSAGRESMSDAAQALCFMAGANSIFTGDKLLTTDNAGDDRDAALFAKLGVTPMAAECKVELAAE